MNFEQAVEHVMRLEGGYVNNPVDPGGETKFGISKRSYPELEIKELSIDDAKAIYKRDFWDKLHIGNLPPYIRLLVFDGTVNQGPQSAIMLLQEVLEVPRDGVIGSKTEFAAHQMSPTYLIGTYAKTRSRRYHAVHDFKTFGLGWMSRLMDVTLTTISTIGE